MTTLHIELDDAAMAAVKAQAARAGKTPEALAAEIVVQQVAVPPNKEWITEFLQLAKTSGADSKGWKWNREELYDR